MKALVTGATGFIGRRLVARLQQPVVLSRDVSRAEKTLGSSAIVHSWNGTDIIPAAAFSGVETIFHLAGEPVGEGRWNDAKRARIRDSRVNGTQALVDSIRALHERPRVLVSVSAVGYYGDRGDESLDESSAHADDFLAHVCVRWEQEALRAEELGLRVAVVRMGVVLGMGGALAKMLTPFRLGVGGRLASGRQWMPWIHIDDAVGILLHAATNDAVRGPINSVAPQPARNADFTQALAKALHRPAIFPMPAFMLRLVMGDFAEIILASQKVVPKVAMETGYGFGHPEIGAALVDVVRR